MMSGVQVHLDSPLPEMRLLGMIVAEALTEKVDVSKQKLQFEVRHMSNAKDIHEIFEPQRASILKRFSIISTKKTE